MSNKKAKKESEETLITEDARKSIIEKWNLKKQLEMKEANIIQQIMGIADFCKLTPDQLNSIIGEKIFQKG